MKNNTIFLTLIAAFGIFAQCNGMDQQAQKIEQPVQPFAIVPPDIKTKAEKHVDATQKKPEQIKSKHRERSQDIESNDNAFAHFLMCISPQLKINNGETQNTNVAKKDPKKNCAVAPKKARTIQAQIESLVQKRLKAKEKAEKTAKHRSRTINEDPYPCDYHYDEATHTFSIFMAPDVINKIQAKIERQLAQCNLDGSDDFFDPEIYVPKTTKHCIFFPFDSKELALQEINATARNRNKAYAAGKKLLKFSVFEDGVCYCKVK